MIKSAKKFMLDLLFPRFCEGCKKEGIYLCQDCKATLEISEYDYCLCNKNPLRITPEKTTGKCNSCKDKKLYGLYSALPYKEKSLTRKLIHKFKYQPYAKELAKTLGDIVIDHLIITGRNNENFWKDSILIPVPLSKKKLKSRGYNQSEELAKEISKHIGLPIATDVLFKIKETPPQMKLTKEERKNNLKESFLVKNPEKIKNKKIFLIDDVYTTGSTMEECANVLRTLGAKQVFGIVIARE